MNPLRFVLRKASIAIASLGVGAKERANFRAKQRIAIGQRKKAVRNSQLVRRGIAEVRKGKLVSTQKGQARLTRLNITKENRIHGRALIERQNDPRFRKN